MKPIKVRLQNCDTQVGIENNPVICWEYGTECGGKRQTACRILLNCQDENCYDSGWMQTNKQNNHLLKINLKSHQHYEIVVEIKDETLIVEKSDCTSFISGISQDSDWKGQWISNGNSKPHYVEKDIYLSRQIKNGYISACGVGQYEMRINGMNPDDSVLNGSWTDYNKHIHYRTFDITKLLKEGSNLISIEVGNGWYKADTDDERHFYTLDKGYEPFGDYLAAIASLTIHYKDGSMQTFGTDENWRIKESATTYTNIYGSEDYDARKETEIAVVREHAIVLAKEEAPKGELVPMLYPPVKVKKIYSGKIIKRYGETGILYDLGQNMSGLFELSVLGEAGQKIRITPVEKLDAEGNPWKTIECWCHYILNGSGKIESWKPKFTYGAGRYLLLEGIENDEVIKLPNILYVRGHFITSSAESTGEFYCSDHRCNQIHDLIIKAVESNLNHVHTDCPTIEKLGWQETNHLMGPSIMYTKNVDTLWSKISGDQRDSQYHETEIDIDLSGFPHEYKAGLLTSIAPRYARFLLDGGEGSFWDIIPWGSSILMAAFEQFRFFGNEDSLIDNYLTAKKYVDYLYDKYMDYNRIYNKSSNVCFLCNGLGDWGISQNKGESRENIETAYFYRDLVLLQNIAEWIGEKEDYFHYETIAKKVMEDYNKTLLVKDPDNGEWFYRTYDREGNVATQANQAIPIQFHMVPIDKLESVQRTFIRSTDCGIMQGGEIGLPYIFRTLSDLKKVDTVYKMIMQDNHPSYYRFVKMGETTLPEFWRDDARSRNHDMMGSILEWFYRYLAGISSEDGYQMICIEPILPKHINEVRCSYQAITGKIEVYLQRTEMNQVELLVSIPANTKGIVSIEGNKYDIEGGMSYRF